MEIELFAEGRAFTNEGLSLDETLQALNSFSSAYKNCLDITTDQILKKSGPRPVLKISHVRPGSLDSKFVVDLTGAVASLTPLIPDYVYQMLCSNSWDLLVKTVKAATALAKHFYENKSPIIYNITAETGATVNIATSGGTINVSQIVDDSIRKSYPQIEQLAKLINANNVSHMLMRSNAKPPHNEQIELEYDLGPEDSKYFSVPDLESTDNDTIELKCKIFSINRKSGNGRLDYFDEVAGPKPIPFSITGGEINDYIEAMKRNIAIVTATRRFVQNALGERKVTHLHLSSISLA